ncbi:extracellular solute-binding protein [Candidatus Woesebacteria bacterium]|nr:extracellular solute-binding protein [Candidatus Woesebacteria bacterium]
MPDQNTNVPVFETIPVEEEPSMPSQQPSDTIIPEVIPEELTPEDVSASGGSGEPPSVDDSLPPMMEEEDDHKKKFIFIAIGVAVFLVIFFFVLSLLFSLGKKTEKVELEYWGLWEDEKIYEGVIQDYEKAHPSVNITYVKQAPEDYRLKLLARIKEGNGPDIFRFHNTWLPTIAEIVSPLPSKVMSNEVFESTFYKVAQNDLKIGNSYYGLPLEIDGLVLIYNNELLRKAGITSPPKTWEELLNAANTLRVQDADGNILTSGISLGTANNIEHYSDILGWMLLQNGANLNKLDSNEAIEVLANYRQFAEPPLNFWSDKMPNNISAFIQGKVAMIIAPSWRILEIKAANAELEVKATSLPLLSGNQPLSLATYWVEGVSKASKNQLEAWQFLNFLIQKDTMTKLYQTQSQTRLFGEPYSRVDLRESLAQNEYIGPVVEQALYMQSLPMISRTFDKGINEEIIAYIEDAINATMKGVSYNQAFATASKGVEQVFAKYNIK